MNLNQRIEAFATLGKFLSQFTEKGIQQQDNIPHNELFFDAFHMQIKRAREYNSWYTKENVLFAIEGWSKSLSDNELSTWLSKYQMPENKPQTVAIIMAGNIPLVGFHDFLSVLISGHKALIKLSSNDKQMLPLLAKYLEHVNPDFKGRITFTVQKLENFDAVIATGSNNTSRYFDYYFGKHPNIIRKNRNSVAILTGKETKEQLEALSDDIFQYFGLGCRSVSKLYIPEDYNFDAFFEAMYKHKDIIYYDKYANNYDYNKAVYLMSLFKLKDNGFLVLKEESSFGSPIATLFYEYYNDLEALEATLNSQSDKIQCIVNNNINANYIDFGGTQNPKLWDYSDGVDTIEFLIKL
ncbi:MAG: acyl-CoA reductase [Flavobacteriaceae bacterium]|nr:MAG: acyl-CoA reductase [Flavobacteriaceae bacterium]